MLPNKIASIVLLALLIITPAESQANNYVANLAYYEGLGGEFSLTSHEGRKVSSKDLNKKIVLLFFGYTTCPDICPTALTNMKVLMNELGDRSNLIQVVFITIDPARDTPEKLNTYVPFFHEDFIGLTGTEEEINQVTRQFGARFIRTEVGSAAVYFFNHSDYIYLIDQSSTVRALYRTQTPTEQMLADIQALVDGEDE